MTDPAYDAFRTRLESGGDADAYNPRSGALGKHQFLASTWLGLVRRHRPAWAQGLSEAQILDKRRDGAISDAMVALFDRGNTEQLAAAGYAATPGNLYLAHHFGAAGAKKILGAADDTPMQSLVSAPAYRANPHLHGKTKAQVLADFARRGGAGNAPVPAVPAEPARDRAWTPFAPAGSPPPPAPTAPAWTPLWRQAPAAPVPPGPAPSAAALPAPQRARDPVPFDPAAAALVVQDDPTPLERLLRMLR